MKKKLLLLLCLMLTVGGTLANDYIQVSNREMPFDESWTKSSDYFNDTSGDGSVSWDAANRKLTLNNFNIWRGAELNYVNVKTCIEINSTKGVTIEVVGNNKIANYKGQTLALHGNTTFRGDGTLKFVNNDDKKPGIDLLEENRTVTVNGPTLKLECKNAGIRGKNNTGNLQVKAGIIEGPKNGKLATGLTNIYFDYGMGVQQPHGAEYSTSKQAMINILEEDISINEKIILGPIKYYGFRVCGLEVTEKNYDYLGYLIRSTGRGTILYYPSVNRLYMYESTFYNNTAHPFISNDKNEGLTIELEGTNVIEFEGSSEREVLDLRCNTNIIEVDNPRYDASSLETNFSGGGINVASGKNLFVKNVTLKMPYIKGGNTSSTLEMGNDVEIIASGSKNGTVRQLKINNVSSRPGVAVASSTAEPRFIWNRTGYAMSGVYKDPSYIATGEVKLSTKSDVQWYPLYICGYRANSLNQASPVNEYVESGTLDYTVSGDSRKLIMKDAAINNYGDKPLIQWTNVNNVLQVNFEGTNTLKCGSTDAIQTNGSLILHPVGNSKTTFTGDNGKITCNELTITTRESGTNITVPEIEAKYFQIRNTTFNVTRKLDAKTFQLSEEVVASTPEAPAYYDSETGKVMAPKGSVSFVPSSEVTVYPGIKFGGQEVNSANHTCVVSSINYSNFFYERTNSPVTVDKKSNGYTINIDRLSGICYEPVFEFDSSIDVVDINVKNKNILQCSSEPFIRSNAKSLTIRGSEGDAAIDIVDYPKTHDGSIELGPGKALCVTNSSATSFNISVPRIYGTDPNNLASLTVNDPYLTVYGYKKYPTIRNVKCYLPTGLAELYSTSSYPATIGNDGVYLNGELCTGEVKFVKKGESYIRATRVEVTPLSLSFTKKGEIQTLSGTVLPEDATEKGITWISMDESVVTVDNYGHVRAVGNGSTRVYAYPQGYQEEEEDTQTRSLTLNYCSVTVDIPEPTDITLDQTEVLIDRESIGGVYLTANLTPSNADTEFTWESSNENVVTVLRNSGQKALVRRIADEGEATITVRTSNGLSATSKVTIHYPITPLYVEFAQRTYTLTEVGEQIRLEPIVTPDNCEKLSYTWNTYGEAISLSDDGTVTALRNGSAVVECWACYDGQPWAQGEVRIYVEIPPDPVIATGLEISSSESVFYSLGESVLFIPTFTPENVTSDELMWESDDTSVAAVDENGLVTTVGWGSCTITATTTDGSEIQARRAVVVIDPSSIPEPVYATGIKLDEKEITIMVGDEVRVDFTITPADYTESIMVEPMEGDISIAEAREDYDWFTARRYISVRSDAMMSHAGDIQYRIRPNAVDMEKLNAMGIWEEPADTLTIHVLDPIIFAAASPEDINVTYHVTDLNDKVCEVYPYYNEMMPEPDPDLAGDPLVTPAVDVTATGKLTVPSRANGYWVTSVKERAFQKCSGLNDIEFSEGIETIGDYACFRRLFSLERVTLPSTIKELGMYCFSAHTSDYVTSEDPSGRNNIREVNIKSFTPPTGLNGSDINWTGAFHQVASDAVLYVPTGALAGYNVEPWTSWFSRIEEKQFFEDPDGIETVESSKLKVESSWYDLSGRKLSGKPAKAGLYINNGKKVVIK